MRRLLPCVALCAFLCACAGGASPSAMPHAQSGAASVAVDAGAAPSPYLYLADERDSRFVVYRLQEAAFQPPVRDVTGSATDLDGPVGIAVDSAGRTFVSNSDLGPNPRIDVFPPGADGNVAPTAILKNGPNASGIAVDASDRLYTVFQGTKIAVYPANPASSTKPVGMIAGTATALTKPSSLTFDAQGNLWVAQPVSHDVLEFAPGAHGNVAPIRVLSGSNTTLAVPTDVQVSPASGNIFVMDNAYQNNRMVIFGSGASGNAKPLRIMSFQVASTNTLFRGEFSLYRSSLYVSENNLGDPGYAAVAKYAASGSGAVHFTGELIVNDIALSDAAFSTISSR